MRKGLIGIAIAATMAAGGVADAGTLVVGGDTTPTFSLAAGNAANTGTRTFYDNLRGGADRVVISQRSFAPPGFTSFANQNLAAFYRESAGVSVVEAAGEITTDLLAGTGLLVLQFPNDAFAGTEVAAIDRYVRAGGTLLLVGEASVIRTTFPGGPFTEGSQADAIGNGLLAGLGSSIRFEDDTIGCCGTFTATGAQIGVHPLTAGVASFRYGAATSVSGGTTLFTAPDDTGVQRAFFMVETLLPMASVPEPASWAMMIVGIGVVGGAARRRGRRTLA